MGYRVKVDVRVDGQRGTGEDVTVTCKVDVRMIDATGGRAAVEPEGDTINCSQAGLLRGHWCVCRLSDRGLCESHERRFEKRY